MKRLLLGMALMVLVFGWAAPSDASGCYACSQMPPQCLPFEGVFKNCYIDSHGNCRLAGGVDPVCVTAQADAVDYTESVAPSADLDPQLDATIQADLNALVVHMKRSAAGLSTPIATARFRVRR